jgi:hypothetical protein
MTSASDVFALLRGALEAASVRYAIGGSWASTAFGEPRFTNDVDILADFTVENVGRFLAGLPATFFADPEEIVRAIGSGRPFNVIYMPMAFKFDFFPAAAFPLGIEELDRAVWMADSGLSEAPAIRHARGYPSRKTALVSVRWRSFRSTVARYPGHRSQSRRQPRPPISGTKRGEAWNRSPARTSPRFAITSTPPRKKSTHPTHILAIPIPESRNQILLLNTRAPRQK